MNRALIITIGIVVIIFTLGVWLYLMLFGAPEKTGEVFTNLGFEISNQDVTIQREEFTEEGGTFVDTNSEALRQITTRPVAGFTFTTNTQGDETVRYVERGTGHVYEINLTSGEETPLSRTTVPQVGSAVFSPEGSTVALTSYTNYQTNVFVGTLGSDVNLIGIPLQPGATNISFESENEVLYSVTTDGATKGYTHNIDTLEQAELFSFNYTNLDVIWRNGSDDIYLATKPAHKLRGFIYKTENNILTPVTESLYGLSAFVTNSHIVTTWFTGDTYVSEAITEEEDIISIPTLALKEKCTADTFSSTILWCAAPLSASSRTFVEDWYKGIALSEDYIWQIDLSTQSSKLHADPEELVGRTIDVKDIAINNQGDTLSFINKIDQTLWVYDLTN